jgi:hypothetical protein
LRIKGKGSFIADSYMQANIFRVEYVSHGNMGSIHQLRGDSHFSVGAENAETCDMAVGCAFFGLLVFHLSKYVPDDSPLGFCHIQELGPAEDVVEIILEVVVLR